MTVFIVIWEYQTSGAEMIEGYCSDEDTAELYTLTHTGTFRIDKVEESPYVGLRSVVYTKYSIDLDSEEFHIKKHSSHDGTLTIVATDYDLEQLVTESDFVFQSIMDRIDSMSSILKLTEYTIEPMLTVGLKYVLYYYMGEFLYQLHEGFNMDKISDYNIDIVRLLVFEKLVTPIEDLLDDNTEERMMPPWNI